MAPNLTSGVFKIVSCLEGNPPTSVNLTKPAWQSVYLNGPVTTWTTKEEGKNAYHLSLGGYSFTGVYGNKVTATVYEEKNVEWIAIYRKHQDAYTVSPMHKTDMGWTVADPDSKNSLIKIEQLRAGHSEPPTYFLTQLFRFEQLHE